MLGWARKAVGLLATSLKPSDRCGDVFSSVKLQTNRFSSALVSVKRQNSNRDPVSSTPSSRAAKTGKQYE